MYLPANNECCGPTTGPKEKSFVGLSFSIKDQPERPSSMNYGICYFVKESPRQSHSIPGISQGEC